MKILVLTKYGDMGASSRVRFLQYVPFLQQHGFQLDVFPLLGNEYVNNLYLGRKASIFYVIKSYFSRLLVLLTMDRYDLVWLENECFPYLPASIELFFLKKKIPYIVNYDDAIFHNYDQNGNFIVRKFLSKKIDDIMRYAQCVIAGNKYIADRAVLAYAKKVELLPSVVDMEKYRINSKEDSGCFVIGWIGTPKTAHFLDVIKEPLKIFSACKKNIILRLVGVKDFALNGVNTVCIPWEEKTEVMAINKINVGIMPLLNSDWEKGKCGYKLIQYMACGKPVIATPIGINSEIVAHGVDGFLAENCEDWIGYLTMLYDDEELRKKMGCSAREKIEKSYSIQSTVLHLVDIMKEAV